MDSIDHNLEVQKEPMYKLGSQTSDHRSLFPDNNADWKEEIYLIED